MFFGVSDTTAGTANNGLQYSRNTETSIVFTVQQRKRCFADSTSQLPICQLATAKARLSRAVQHHSYLSDLTVQIPAFGTTTIADRSRIHSLHSDVSSSLCLLTSPEIRNSAVLKFPASLLASKCGYTRTNGNEQPLETTSKTKADNQYDESSKLKKVSGA